jgi:hypothetical protein
VTAEAQTALPICEECGRAFSSPRGLAAHLKVHDAPVICPRCGQSVRYLVPHLRNEHPLSERDEQLLDGLKGLIERNRTLEDRVKALERHIVDSGIPPFGDSTTP